MSQKESPLMTAPPEKLSGHDLVNYLIANPGARDNSCKRFPVSVEIVPGG